MPIFKARVTDQTTQVTGSGIMCEPSRLIPAYASGVETAKFSGINNVGLMTRALILKDDPSPDERESVKWQTLQVSTLSIASCIGRILIGNCLSRVL